MVLENFVRVFSRATWLLSVGACAGLAPRALFVKFLKQAGNQNAKNLWRFAPAPAPQAQSYTHIKSGRRHIRRIHTPGLRGRNIVRVAQAEETTMATPETHSVELDPLPPPFDGELNAVESEDNQVVDADARELPAYGFDSDDKTLVGIGTSGSADSVRHFDSSDQTLVGIGPAERAKRARAKAAELASRPRQAESVPDDVPMPHSEPPGPFVASDDDQPVPVRRLPMRKVEPWLLVPSAVLLAAAAVALLRGVVPRSTAPRLHSDTTILPLPTANETHSRPMQFATAAATSTETCALEIPMTQAPEASRPAALPATASHEKQPDLAPRSPPTNWVGREPLGALDITSNPPSSLVLDGRPLGKAPRIIELASGPHTVLFIHPERGRVSVTVNVRAGRTTSASADF